MRKSHIPFLALAGLLTAMLQVAPAQTVRGDFSGIVRDTSGAVVPHAQVIIINQSTTARREIQTDEQGRYFAPGFFVDTYRIEVSKQGFHQTVIDGVQLKPATVTPVDVILQVGGLQEAVTVTASAPVIQSEAPSVNYGLDSAAYGKYEMNTSGNLMSPFSALHWTSGYASGKSAFMVFRGAPTEYTGFSLEGLTGRGIRFRVPELAVKSGEIVAFSAPAEHDRAVTVNSTMRSGTNDLHGEFETFFINPVLNAVKTPFYQGKRDPGVSKWRYNLGAGGPVVLPGLYDGRNRTFWYFAWQRNKPADVRYVQIDSIPTAKMRTGDFSAWGKTVKDPLSSAPFPGNVVPSDRISSVAKAVDQIQYGRYTYVGDPNSTISNATTQYFSSSPATTSLVKLDHNFSNGDVMNAFFTWSPKEYREATPAYESEISKWYAFNFAHTHLFSPAIVNQLRIGTTRNKDYSGKVLEDGSFQPEYGADVLARLGLRGVNPPGNWQGWPDFSISNWPYFEPYPETKTVYSYYSLNDSITISRGRHEIKAGFSTRKIRHDWSPTGNLAGSYTFNGKFSSEPYADFLMGYPATFSRTSSRTWIEGRRWEYGAFAQDTFRITSKVMITYGLRWSRYTVPVDGNGMYYNFDLKSLSVVVPDQFALSQVAPSWPSSAIPVKLASELGYADKLMNSHSNWGPRFGFTWRPASDWVVRAGYGSYTGVMAFTELQTAGPFAVSESYVNLLSSGKPQYSFPNPFPSQTGSAGVSSATAVDPDFRTGYTQSWNLTAEKQLLRSWGLRLSYLGNKTTGVPYSANVNTPLLSTQAFSTSRRPYQSFNTLTYITNGGNAYYDSMEIAVSRPMANGLYMQASYSYNRSEMEIHNQRNPEAQVAGAIDYAYDRARDKGNNVDWPRHDFVVNYVYELPVGRERRFLHGLGSAGVAGKVLNGVIGDWAASGYFNWHSGNWFTPTYSGVDPGGINQFSGRADVVPGCDPYAGGKNLGKGALWFNSACFAVPAAGTLGNAKINSLVGPGAWVFAINPYKEFPIRERVRARLGAQIYNLFNHPSYDVPNSVINRTTGGLITALGNMRRASQGGAMRNFVLVGAISF